MDVSPNGGGTIKINGSAPSSYPHVRTVNSGSNVTLEVVPAAGYLFQNWSEDLSGTATIATVVMDCNRKIQANFLQTDTLSQAGYTLTVLTNGSGSTVPPAGTVEYTEGQRVTVTAAPADGWQFGSWNGDVADPSLPQTTIIIDSAKTVTANFEQITHDLNIDIHGGGSVKYKPGTNVQAEGTVVTLRAVPDDGWQFESWTGEVANPDSAVTTVTMDSDKKVVATFSEEEKRFPLLAAAFSGILVLSLTAMWMKRLRKR